MDQIIPNGGPAFIRTFPSSREARQPLGRKEFRKATTGAGQAAGVRPRPSAARMVPAVGVLQIGQGEAQVALGGGEALVAGQFLDVPDVGAVL